PSATHHGAVDPASRDRHRPRGWGALSRGLGNLRGGQPAHLCHLPELQRLDRRPHRAGRLAVQRLLPPVQRHPAPVLGRRLRLRDQGRLSQRLDRGRRLADRHGPVVDRRPETGLREARMDDRRTPLARARGLGSAKEGVHHWWVQRLTAIALIPLVVWFAISLVMLSGADYPVIRAWLGAPLARVLLILT